MSDSQAIANVFFTDLMASFKEAEQCFEPLYLAFGDGSDDYVFGVNTRPGYIFDDNFWDVFHAHPLHVCHVTRLTDGPQFDENRVFEIRFKVSKEQAALEQQVEESDLEAKRLYGVGQDIEEMRVALEQRVERMKRAAEWWKSRAVEEHPEYGVLALDQYPTDDDIRAAEALAAEEEA